MADFGCFLRKNGLSPLRVKQVPMEASEVVKLVSSLCTKQGFLLHTLGIPLISPCSQYFTKLVLASIVSQKFAILVAYLQ
jgi:hypothetical protein